MRHINVHVGDSPLPLHPFSVAAAAAPPPPPPPPPPLATPVCLGLFHFRGDALRILHFTNVPVISRDTRSFEFGVSKGWYRSVLLKICRPSSYRSELPTVLIRWGMVFIECNFSIFFLPWNLLLNWNVHFRSIYTIVIGQKESYYKFSEILLYR